MIRSLQPSDVPAIIHLGARMHEESQYSLLNFDPQCVAGRCYQIIDSPDTMIGLVVVDYTGHIIGMMGGYLAPYEYGDDLTASDILVYVEPEHRGGKAFFMMVKGYVSWARSKGAKLIFLNQSTGINPEATSHLYQRLGFRPCGSNHCMEAKG